LTPATFAVNNVNLPLIAPQFTGCSSTDVGLTSGGTPNPNAINLAAFNISSSTAGATISGATTITQSAALTAPGFIGIWGNASSNLTICGAVNITLPTTGGTSDGVFIYANGVSVSNINISGVNQTGGTEAGLRVDRTAAFIIGTMTVSDYIVAPGGAATCVPLSLNAVVNGSISGFQGAAVTTLGANLSSIVNLTIVNSRITSTGTTAITTAGTCTGSSIEKSVNFGVPSKMNNAGTGLIVEQRAAAMPTAGTFAIGDNYDNTAIAAAAATAWGRATAGSSHTLGTDWKIKGTY
jgi:hypothetical protein